MKNLYQVDANSGATAQLLPFGDASYPIGLAYDPVDKLIYWNDFWDSTVNRYSFLMNSSIVIYRDTSGKHVSSSSWLSHSKFRHRRGCRFLKEFGCNEKWAQCM